MADVVALGELLIDFVPTVSGVTLVEAPTFQKAPGGAPANVVVGLARLGIAAGFMGQVGDDAFGHFLAQTLRDNQVDVSALRFSSAARTALAFVSLKADGERDFMFYRHPSADMLYQADDVDDASIRRAKVFHFGSISLIGEPSRTATLHAIEVAQAAGLLISYDPNLRLNLWPGSAAAKTGLRLGWSLANVVKASEEEVQFLNGTASIEQSVRSLWHPNLRLVIVTQGSVGCTYYTPSLTGTVAGFRVPTVDTTGAGDAFVAGLLKGLLADPEALQSADRLYAVCRYANAVGALTTTQRGAIPALPTARQVEALLSLADT